MAALSAPDAANLVRAIREGESPWPASSTRTAVFALDVAMTSLNSGTTLTRDEALRLLVETNAAIRQLAPDDAFECAWLRAEAAALEGLYVPHITSILIERATGRCPGDARLRLALAVASDQRLAQRRAGARLAFDRAAGAGPDASRVMNPVTTEEERRVLSLYDAAAGSPETRHEAKVRAAWLHLRTGRYHGRSGSSGWSDGSAGRSARPLPWRTGARAAASVARPVGCGSRSVSGSACHVA